MLEHRQLAEPLPARGNRVIPDEKPAEQEHEGEQSRSRTVTLWFSFRSGTEGGGGERKGEGEGTTTTGGGEGRELKIRLRSIFRGLGKIPVKKAEITASEPNYGEMTHSRIHLTLC